MSAPAHLFAPLVQRSITLPNRIVVSPMCQYSYTDGLSDDWQFVHLGSRAVGGAGVVMTEAAAVSPEGRISPGDLGIWSDVRAEAIARIPAFIRQQGAIPAIQLAHAGRKASMTPPWGFTGTILPTSQEPTPVRSLSPAEGGWQVFGPTSDPYSADYATPLALDRAGMDKILADFAAAAKRAAEAGFLIAEVHAAHGYLAHEFLSPLSNTRTDEYGGSRENRMKFPLEIVRAVRTSFPEELPVWVRISATDWVEGGITIEDSVAFAKVLKAEGVDLIDTSSAGNDRRQQIPVGAGYQVHLAAQIRAEAGIATGAVGLITSPEQADQILRSGQADVVLLAREMLRNPYWPMHAAEVLHQTPSYPVQYERAAAGKPIRRQPL